MSDDALRAEGTVPYYTYSEGTETGCYYRCERCGFGIKSGEFMQRPKIRPRKGNKRGWHYDCDDPTYQQVRDMMREDGFNDMSRGYKSKVSSYHNGRR